MTAVEELWVGKTFTVIWPIRNPVNGAPIVDSDVTGIVRLPGGGDAPMTIDRDGSGRVIASFTPTVPGEHVWALKSAGSAIGAQEGSVNVLRSRLGALPIETDRTTDVGMVRLLATDTNEAAPLFTDDDVRGFLAIEGGNVRCAAALALETIATNEALVSKKITTQSLSTDGPAVSDALLKRAAELRKQAAGEDVIDPETNEAFAAYVIPFEPGNRW
ncbi:MAG: hypothetical protein ABW022_16040 [Actinoplanes sp.]